MKYMLPKSKPNHYSSILIRYSVNIDNPIQKCRSVKEHYK